MAFPTCPQANWQLRFLGTGLSILALVIPGPICVRQIDKAAATSHLVIQSHTSQKVVSSIVFIFCVNCRFIKFTGQSPFLVAVLDPDWTYIPIYSVKQAFSSLSRWERRSCGQGAILPPGGVRRRFYWLPVGKKDGMPRYKAGVTEYKKYVTRIISKH